MHDPLLVRRFKSVGDLASDGQRIRLREWPPRNPICQGRALDQLHDQRACDARLFEAVDLCDMGMVQGGQRLCFAFETPTPLGIGGKGLGENLQRDVAIQLRIARAVDFAHSSCANGVEDLVRAEARAGSQRHRAVRNPRRIICVSLCDRKPGKRGGL
jgi:hypothetical protein